LIETTIGSVREIEFGKIQTNFFVLFPKGVLEAAPKFHVIVSRVNSEAQSATFQQALVEGFPNVSAIDLTQILKSVESVLSKVSFVIRFMAFFSILTGLLATFQFKIPFTPRFWPSAALFATITGLTVFIGLVNSREVVQKPPLEVLRKEV